MMDAGSIRSTPTARMLRARMSSLPAGTVSTLRFRPTMVYFLRVYFEGLF